MMIILERAELLKFFRMRAKLSKTKVAEHLGVTAATITNYEKGATIPSYQNFNKLKKLYGPEFEYALSKLDDEDKTPRLEFRDILNSQLSEDFNVMEQCYPTAYNIIKEIKEKDKAERRLRAAQKKKNSQN